MPTLAVGMSAIVITCRNMPTASVGMAPSIHLAAVEVHAFAVRPAMAEHVDHPLERFLPHGLVGFIPYRAGDSAHDADNMPQAAAKQGQ
jgi:hypothetical protein